MTISLTTFVADTPAVADEINDNFTALKEPLEAAITKQDNLGIVNVKDYNTFEDALATGKTITIPKGTLARTSSLEMNHGYALVGNEAVTYREDQGDVSIIQFNADVDGLTYNDTASYCNMVKNLKITNNLSLGSSTKTGINFTAGNTSAGIGNILDNVTVQNFLIGIDLYNDDGNDGTAQDNKWYQSWGDIKLFNNKTGLILGGSNGTSRINSLNITGSDTWGSGSVGLQIEAANGISIGEFSTESNYTGLWFTANCLENHRIDIQEAYFESTKNKMIQFSGSGKLFIHSARMAFYDNASNIGFYSLNGNLSTLCVVDNLYIRGGYGAYLFQFQTNGLRINSLDYNGNLPLCPQFGNYRFPDYVGIPAIQNTVDGTLKQPRFEMYGNTVTNKYSWTCRKEINSSSAPTKKDAFYLTRFDGSNYNVITTGSIVRNTYNGITYTWDGYRFKQDKQTATAIPTTGVFDKGDIIVHSDAASGETMGWQCTTAGSLGTLTRTGTITTGKDVLILDAITNVLQGAYITIAGVTGVKRILDLITAIGSTTLTAQATSGQAVLTVADTANFALNEYVVVDQGQAGEESGQIRLIDSTAKTITLYSNLTNTHSIGATVKNGYKLDSVVDATVTNAAVAHSAAVLKAMPNLA